MKFKYSIFIFIILFPISIFIWQILESGYYIFLVEASSFFLQIYNIELTSIEILKDGNTLASFVSNQIFPFSKEVRLSTFVEINNLASITFNIPLTISILIALSLSNRFYIKEFLEAIFLLFILHLITLDISILKILTEASHFKIAFSDYFVPSFQVLSSIELFLINYLIKAEPFLIGGFLLFRRGVIKFDLDKYK